jgi:hypothetical protein
VGTHILTLAPRVTKLLRGGQLPEDSASRARDADPQEANVLDETRRVSRLMAKTRRDNGKHIGSGGDTIWKTVTTVEYGYCGQARGSWSGWWAYSLASLGLQSPRRWERARKSTLAYLRYLCSYQGTDLHLPLVGRPAWAANDAARGRVTVVVVGVTSHQGDDSAVSQGEGSQVKAFNSG